MSTNERIKTVIVGLESEILDVVSAIEILKEISLQKSDEDIWDSIKDQVAGLIDEKILEKQLEEKKTLIEGVRRTMNRYRRQ